MEEYGASTNRNLTRSLNMNEVIRLKRENLSADITPNGAWLTNLEQAGKPVLFPKQTFKLPDGSQKVRGGCHICLPNFGPGGVSDLPQHGFGREQVWSVLNTSSTSATLKLIQQHGSYDGLESTLSYDLFTNGIDMTLKLLNNGNDAMRVSPGFHPYFAAKISASIDNQSYSLDGYTEAQIIDGIPERLEVDHTKIMLSTRNLSVWILWSDRLSDYICLEPTYAANSFEYSALIEEYLQPGEDRTYSFSITMLVDSKDSRG